MVVTGLVALSWLGFVTHSMQASVRDRERLTSFYAAESGLELAVDWFNNPDFHDRTITDHGAPPPRNFGSLRALETAAGRDVVTLHSTPVVFYDGSDTKATIDLLSDLAPRHPERYELPIPELRQNYNYGIFEPFVRDYLKDFEGIPTDSQTGLRMWDAAKGEWINGYGPHDLIPIRFTYFYPGPTPMSPINTEEALNISVRSKIPSMTIDLTGFAGDLPEEIAHLGFRFGRDLRNSQQAGLTFARLESIELVHPTEILAELQTRFNDRRISGPVATKVIATGISRSGIRTTVETYLAENDLPNLGSNAALMSQNGIEFTSHTNIRWGEIWTYGDHILQNPWRNHYPKTADDGVFRQQGNTTWDPWFAHRITASPENWGTSVYFRDESGDYLDGSRNRGPFHDTPPAQNKKAYNIPLNADELHSSYRNQYGGYDNLLQNVEFTIVPKNYEAWKSFFLDHMPQGYFFTDEQNRIWGLNPNYPGEDQPRYINKSFDEWFGVEPGTPDYWDFDRLFVFIDSIPVNDQGQYAPKHPDHGYPMIDSNHYPRDPTKQPEIAKLATIKEAGGGTHTRGVIFAAAHLEMMGQGKAADPNLIRDPFDPSRPYVVMPNGEVPNLSGGEAARFTISHNGLLHSWGRIINAGQRTFYGSVHADEGFWEVGNDGTQYGGKGTPSVYYNYRMGDGSWLTLNQSRVRRNLWDLAAINRVDQE